MTPKVRPDDDDDEFGRPNRKKKKKGRSCLRDTYVIARALLFKVPAFQRRAKRGDICIVLEIALVRKVDSPETRAKRLRCFSLLVGYGNDEDDVPPYEQVIKVNPDPRHRRPIVFIGSLRT